ncbi:hypothetical protein I551_8726 [Mycobacterium ulcerans str. Harvey]|uniref:Diacylglycerol O-acyltransferase n=1 Tax=Mycobacterium ulcerans str. Harvey TaxID=1299332 RepID=A0ABP3ASJ2_MYCUL|nr:hypothetical protein I551_8726 [Mycobacterium ulcerans str. Harvey]
MGVLPLQDGGTAVSVVITHSVVDGVAGGLAVFEAINGITRDFGYPPPDRAAGWKACSSIYGMPFVDCQRSSGPCSR